MKNKTYYLGILSALLIIFGCIFKAMHWPAAGILITLGMTLLCLLFLPIAFISSYKNSGYKKKWLFIAAFLTLFIDFIGALFKIMHWPGAGILLHIGILLPVILFLPVFLYHHYKEKEETLQNFMYIMFFLVYLSGMSALLALNVSKVVLDNSVAVNKMLDVTEYYEIKKGALIVEPKNEKLIELEKYSSRIINEIQNIKIENILTAYEGNDQAIRKDNTIDYYKVKGKDDTEVVYKVMLKEGKASELKKEIDSYRNYILSYFDKSNIERIKYYNEIFNTKSFLDDEEEISWERATFHNLHLTFALNKLSEIENNVRLAELELITMINNKSSL
ncbi:hypothetical protein ACFLTE_01275 [Bacteroidota bacterium]